MADPTGATPDGGVPSIPDLNDPNTRLDRASAMAAMSARRRETVLADMNADERAAFTAEPADPAEDTSATDAAAEAERARLEQEALQARVDAGNQIERAGAAADPVPEVTAPPAGRRVLSEDELDNTYVTVKVNGVEQTISVREQRARAQKVSAADQYLEEARNTLREVKQIAAQLPTSQVDQQTGTTTAAQPASDGTTPPPSAARAAIKALFEGDEEAAAANLERLAATATPAANAQPNVEQLAHQVEARMVVRRAVQEFSRANAQIVNDPIARHIANQKIAEELAREGVKDLVELPADTMQAVLARAGTATSNYFRQMSGLAPAATPRIDEGLNRKAAKEALHEPTTAGTRASTSAPQPSTPSDVIARMQASRQPQTPPTRR